MSTQTSGFPAISFNIAQPFQNVRILELPEELLEIITKASSKDSDDEIYLKSSPASEESSATSASKEGFLHLCTNDRAWLVKQVSTSNSVFVAKTSTDSWNEDVLIPDPDAVGGGLSAFAKPTSLLELHPLPATGYENMVKEQLERLVPRIDSQGLPGKISDYSIGALYEQIAAPKNAITKALAQQCVIRLPWKQSTAFQDTLYSPTVNEGKAYIPTPPLLLATWKQIVEAATISETRVTGDLEADILLDAFCQAESEELERYKAVAQAMFADEGYFVALGLITKAISIETKDHLNEMDLARWVGNVVLQAHDKQQAEKEAFERDWEDAVPVLWAKYCSVEVLGNACAIEKVDEEEIVIWRKFGNDSEDEAAAQQEAVMADSKPPAAAAKGKRKWHDKFATSRNVKR